MLEIKRSEGDWDGKRSISKDQRKTEKYGLIIEIKKSGNLETDHGNQKIDEDWEKLKDITQYFKDFNIRST